jgi:lysophospholipase L1-like esterase
MANDTTSYDPTVLHSVLKSAEAIRNKVYGKDTREAMAQMGEKLVAEMSDTGFNAGEIIDARKSYNTLGAREDAQDATTALKSDKSYVDAMLASIAQGGPKGLYYSLGALQTAYPSGADGTYLVFDSSQTDGSHSYIWDSSAKTWKDLGAYQAEVIPNDSIGLNKLTDDFKNQFKASGNIAKISDYIQFEVGKLSETDGSEVVQDSNWSTYNALRSTNFLNADIFKYAIIKTPINSGTTNYTTVVFEYDELKKFVQFTVYDENGILDLSKQTKYLKIVVNDDKSTQEPAISFADGWSIRMAINNELIINENVEISEVSNHRYIGSVIAGNVFLNADNQHYVVDFLIKKDGILTVPLMTIMANNIYAGVLARNGVQYDTATATHEALTIDSDNNLLKINTGLIGQVPAIQTEKHIFVSFDYNTKAAPDVFEFEPFEKQYVSNVPNFIYIPTGENVVLYSDEMLVGDLDIFEAAKNIRTLQGTSVLNEIIKDVGSGTTSDFLAAFNGSHNNIFKGIYLIQGFDGTKAKNAAPKILVIGESTSADPRYFEDLNSNLSDVKPTWIGTQKITGSDGTIFSEEAIGGDTLNQLVNSDRRGPNNSYDNAFFNNNKFDFANYVKNKLSGVTPDIVLINYGINDGSTFTDVNDLITKFMSNLDTVISSIKNVSSSIKIIIGLSHLPAPTPHCGFSDTRLRSRISELNAALITKYDGTQTNVSLAPMNLGVSLFDFNITKKYIDQTNMPEVFEYVVGDTIHPGDKGYMNRAKWSSYAVRNLYK